MFGLRKKEMQEVKMTPVVPDKPEEKDMELKEYISVDSIKAHLVEILENNRKLQEEFDRERTYNGSVLERYKKEKEVALIEADEWKKRARESDQKIKKLEKDLDKKDQEIEQLLRERNDLIVAAEMEKEEKWSRGKKKEDVDSDATSTNSGT